MRAIVLALLLVATIAPGCTSPEKAPAAPEDEGWRVVDTEGATYTPSSTQGEPLLVFFMATWCSTCKAMTDDVAEVHATYMDRGLQVLSVTWDPQEGHEDLERWKETYDQPWPHGIDPDFTLHRTYQVRSQSSVIVLDANGTVVEHWGFGQADRDAMAQAVEDALARQA
ncbi:MAG: TlpA disulfide reductase family protein [Candidatus Thermoplasmatota archaeon]|nr:TlpA disulfide reductase family protein [Candidatus Thermoplasmatota archaeon]